jgi:hypothetical protein
MENVTLTNLVSYIETIKLYVSENRSKFTDSELELVSNFPSRAKLLHVLSEAEIRIVQNSVDYIWHKMTKKNIENPLNEEETLRGNYWMFANGILIKGVNHTTMIKNNINLICTLLNINSLTLFELLGRNYNKLIKHVIDKGGIRLFVTGENVAFIQMSDETYSSWGKKRMQLMNFDKRVVKVIDRKSSYEGWKSGVYIRDSKKKLY